MATKGRQSRRAKTDRAVTPPAVPTTEPVVSFIIVNYNTPDLTTDCVQSILTQREAPPYEIIVVDNASPDKSGTKLAQSLKKDATVIQAARNLGFGAANNLGASNARGRYLFLVNSDTVLPPNCLWEMVELADRHPEYGLLAPRVLLPGRKQVTQPASFGRTATIARLLTRRVDLPAHYLDGFDEIAPCDWVTGAAMLIPAEIYNLVGGFDSQFFMYYEDQDLCASVRQAGWQVGVAPDTTIVHFGGRSSKLSRDRYRLYDQSQRRYILKRQGVTAFILFWLLAWPWKLWRAR